MTAQALWARCSKLQLLSGVPLLGGDPVTAVIWHTDMSMYYCGGMQVKYCHTA